MEYDGHPFAFKGRYRSAPRLNGGPMNTDQERSGRVMCTGIPGLYYRTVGWLEMRSMSLSR